MPDRLAYKPAEAADLLDMSRSKLYELLASGEIKSLKIDRSRRVRHDELVAYLDRLEADQAVTP